MLKLLKAIPPSRRFFYRDIIEPNPPNGEEATNMFDDIEKRLYGAGHKRDKIPVVFKDTKGRKREILVYQNVDTPLSCLKKLSFPIPGKFRHPKDYALAIATYPSGAEETLSLTNRLTESCEIEFVELYPTKKEHATKVRKAFVNSAGVLALAAASEISVGAIHPCICKDEFTEHFSFHVETDEWVYCTDFRADFESEVDVFKEPGVVFRNLFVPKEIASDYGSSTSMTLCRLEDHTFFVDGPTIVSPRQIGHIEIFPEEAEVIMGTLPPLSKFCGVAFPVGFEEGTSTCLDEIFERNVEKKSAEEGDL